MTDSRYQQRPPGSSQRDVAFSNIFGSAPPPGRSTHLPSTIPEHPNGNPPRMRPASHTPPPVSHTPPPMNHDDHGARRSPQRVPVGSSPGFSPNRSNSPASPANHQQNHPVYSGPPQRSAGQAYAAPSSIPEDRSGPPNQRPYSASPRQNGYWDPYSAPLRQQNGPGPGAGLHVNTQVAGAPPIRHQRSAEFTFKQTPPLNPPHPPTNRNNSPGVSPSTKSPPIYGQIPIATAQAQARSVSNPHRPPVTAAPGAPGWRPAPSNNLNDRSMSLTANSSGAPNALGRLVTFDRDHVKNRTMTISGRVIPQRQPGPGVDFMVSRTMNGAASREASISSVSSSTTIASSATKLPSAKSSTSLLGLRRGDTKSSMRSQHSTDERSHAGTILTTSRKVPLVYPALLSKVGEIFFQMVPRGDRVKNELTYKNAFTGQDAVDIISYIIKTPDRNLALLLGRALDAQKFFHDVTYDHRLRDISTEVYQFNEIVVEQAEELHRRESTASINSSTATLAPMSSPQPVPTPNNEGHSAVVVNVNGVFTLLAECYSPTCTREMLCYSIACPRRLEQQARLNMKPQPGLKRSESRLSLHGDDEKEQKLWIHTVSQEVADSVDEKEKKRQEVICEVIYTERDFVKDLEYLRDFWIKPLRSTNIIPEFRREKVIRAIFSNAMEVHSINIKLAEALTKRQQLMPVVRQIGDIFLEFVPKFEPFIRYGATQLYGKYEFERERSVNATFSKFVDETERKKESRKLELNGYLTKPTTRLARYPLLLEAVLKHTADDNPDKHNIPEAISIIRTFLTKVNIESGKAENRFNLIQLSQSLVFRPGEYVDMKLNNDKRQIIFKGSLKRRTGDKDNQGDIQLYLFDNTLLFVKVKIVNKREQLKVHRKPIPLELLLLAESEEIAPRSFSKRSSSSLIPSTKSSVASKAETVNGRFPITFQHLGRRGYEITLYSGTYIGRKKWVEHIENQKQLLWTSNDVYTQRIVQKSFFSTATNRINCISPFDGGRKMLFGTDSGIYISDVKYEKDGGSPVTTTPVKVISIPNVTQIDVLDNKFMTLLALSDKNLYSWPLECVETPDPVGNNRRAKKVMGHINFYKAGTCLGRFLVCTVKSSSMTSTVRVLEPFDPQPRGRRQPPLRRFLASQSEGLKVFKEFYIPSEVLSISFLRRRLCVGCAKGFEIVDLNTLETQSLLDPADTSLDFAIRKEALKPSSIYRLHNDFLLNYSDFSFFVNSHGWKSKPEWMIYWEGLPQHFALAYPYLLAFDSNFIEIRHMDTGDLVRVIIGENIRFLHEGTREILYVHEDEHGNDEVVLLDFWEKSVGSGSADSGTASGSGNGNGDKDKVTEIREEDGDEAKVGGGSSGRSELD